MIRTRFAPSPTGFVHIGSLRTALFAFLFARSNYGKNILRIEDTDQNRKVEGALENLLKVMKEVGVEFDEGFYLKDDDTIGERGEYGPYLQSKRLNKYQEIANQLIEKGKAYFCFCSQERLDTLKKEQTALKKPPMYDRLCKKLSDDEIKNKLEEFKNLGKNPVIRFAIPTEGKTIIHDLIYGDIFYDHIFLDDQVIIKSDGFPTYHLAVVVDDHFMEITHVIRGDEWLPSTPKHLLIYEALGWEPTKYAHLPLILNPDKSKLSKRQGDVSVEDFLKHGYLKEALLNFVAFLGWNPKTEKELFTLDELIKEFDLAKINKAGAVLDDSKLDWFNSQYIKRMGIDELVEKLKPYWVEAQLIQNNKEDASLPPSLSQADISLPPSLSKEGVGGVNKKFPNNFLTAIAKLEQERLKKLSEIGERTKFFFSLPDYNSELLVWKKSTAEDAKNKLEELYKLYELLTENDFTQEILENKTKEFIAKNGFDNGSVLWPLRVSLTGLEKSPSPFEVAVVLALGFGKQEILNRIQIAIKKLK